MTAKTEIYSTPSLPDKAPGIHEALGSSALLLRAVRLGSKVSRDANDIIGRFASLQANQSEHFQYCLNLGMLSSYLGDLAVDAGRLLACIDVVLAAADYGMYGCDCAEDLRRGYYLEYQALLREAEQKGLPSDYTSAPMRKEQRKACGLRRPDFIETNEKGGNKNT